MLRDLGVKQILYRVDIALFVHTKNSLRSHLRAIMALDRGKQIRGKQIRPSFLRANQSFIIIIFFIHHI